jgi:membrane protease YdiL (CAAX protease family)
MILRLLGPPTLAVLSVLWLGRSAARRGLLPMALQRDPWRRVAAGVFLAGTLWLGVFLPLGAVGTERSFDPESVHTGQLFLLHGILVLGLVLTFVLSCPGEGPGGFFRRLGFRTGGAFPVGAGREIALGLAVGLAAWAVVLGALLALVTVIVLLGLEDWLPRTPPEVVPWIAGLPVAIRVLVSLSAGVVEETFFRGFLQPRAGVAFSTACFVLAHLSYGAPFLLIGVTLLSLIYAGLVLWRRSVWAAATAHFVFDAVQLLVIIPAVLETLPGAAGAGGDAAVGAALVHLLLGL